tara:strand:+ start:271 stop:477 length:207 start_codon:yes stop_codon:yes gene_type:complete
MGTAFLIELMNKSGRIRPIKTINLTVDGERFPDMSVFGQRYNEEWQVRPLVQAGYMFQKTPTSGEPTG